MKVCHVITRMIVGGAQENTLFSARGLVESGHETVLVTGPSPGPEGELLHNSEYPLPFPIAECPDLVRRISPWHDWKAYCFLKKFFQENRFDVVHTHSSKAGIIGRLAARAAGVPLVVHTVHGLAFHRFEKPWKNAVYIALEKIAAGKCDKIYTVAQAMIDQCLDAGIGRPEQYKVVYSGMDINRFLDSRRDMQFRKDLNIPEDACVVGTVARLFPLKGYEELFPVIPDLIRNVPKIHFLFVGNGSLREKLEKEARENGFLDRVTFAGLVPPHEVHKYIAQMDVLVHFSLREGLPRAAVQGLACGKPVMAYCLDGTPEVVRHGETGLLVRPGDTRAIEAGLEMLLKNPAECERMGKNGQMLVKDRFAWQTMSSVLIRSYREELQKKNI